MSSSAPPRFPVSAVPPDFGERLALERRARRWSHGRLAEEAGLRRETVFRLEAGRRPVADTVFRLEAALDLLPGTLVPDWPEWAPIGSSSLGACSRRRRRQLGRTLAEIAALVGVSPATLSRFEREECATHALVVVSRTAMDTEFSSLTDGRLASALGFDDAAAFEDWCSAPG